ncbi:MAG: FAD-binding protein [Polyangiales bacterium]
MLEQDLARLVAKGRCSTDSADRVAYARDLWPRKQIEARAGNVAPYPPGVIVWPDNIEELVAVVRYAREHAIPVVPFGAGSGVCGGVRAGTGSILVDMKRMRRVISLDTDRLQVSVEAGMLGQHLEDYLLARGFTLGHYPSSIHCSTVGGWVAARSAGQCSGRYGKIEDMIVALTCVDGAGEVRHATRDGENESLIPLVTGSEGIAAIVTDVTLQISPAPASRTFGSFMFPTTRDGLHAIRHIYQSGLRPAVARLYDPFDTRIGGKAREKERSKPKRAAGETSPGNTAPGLGTRLLTRALKHPGALNRLIHGLPDSALGGAMLVLMWEDDARIGEAELAEASRIARRFGGNDAGEGPARRWLKHRHSVSYRQSPIFAGGGFADTMEISATWTNLWHVHEAVRAAVAPHVFVMAHFSHAYPDGGSIYFTFAGSAGTDAEALERYDAAWQGALRAVIEAGGAVSHHHGVGHSKAAFMRDEQGYAIDLVRAMKRGLDPANILNPGTLLPDAAAPTSSVRVPRPPAPPASGIAVDRESLLAHVRGDVSLRGVEAELQTAGLTLGAAIPSAEMTVREWVESGCPGARDVSADPTDQWIAGLRATLPNGEKLEIRPAPRKAVGPDWTRAFIGSRGRLGVLDEAWLVVEVASELKHACYLFANAAARDAAFAWIRGSGARPARAVRGQRPEGPTLALSFDGPAAVRDATLVVAHDECVSRRGAVQLDAELCRESADTSIPRPDSVLDLVIHELGRHS